MKAFLGILAVLILVSIGYAAYTFVKQDPPEVIIDVVTSQTWRKQRLKAVLRRSLQQTA